MSQASTPTVAEQSALRIGRVSASALALIVANAGLLVAYFVYDATLFQLVLVMWCECLWIGIFSAIKLIAASLLGSPYENRWARFSRGGAVITSIVVIGLTSTSFFSLLGLLLLLILGANDLLPLGSEADRSINHIGFAIGVSFLFVIGHGLSLIGNFLLLGEFRQARAGTLIALPFKRCLALLATIIVAIGAAALLPSLATTTTFAAVLILSKLGWDLRLHVAERRAFAFDMAETTCDES